MFCLNLLSFFFFTSFFFKITFYLSSTPDEDHVSKAFVFLIVLYVSYSEYIFLELFCYITISLIVGTALKVRGKDLKKEGVGCSARYNSSQFCGWGLGVLLGTLILFCRWNSARYTSIVLWRGVC